MPAAPAAPPPAAPAKPAQPAPAAPAPKHEPIQPPPEKDPGDWMAAESAELDSLDEDAPKKPKETKKPVKAEEPENPKVPEKPEEETVPGEEEAKPAEKPAEPEKPVKAADLRRAYEESQRKIREELSPQVAKLQARVRELESSKPAEMEPLQAKLSSLEKRNAELEQRVEFLDYQKSEKFQKEHWQPYVDKYNEVLTELSQVEVELSNGQKRMATEDDLLEVWNLEGSALRTRADALFGDSADDVLPLIKEAKRLGKSQAKALADAEKNSQERINARKAEAITTQTEKAKKWEAANNTLAEKYPTYFKTVDGDVEGNKRLERGRALTALHWHTRDLTQEEIALLPASFQADIQAHGRLSPDNTIRLHALIKNKADNHDRLAYQNKQLRAELKEAKEALKEYEGSEPPGGGGSPGGGGGGTGRWDDDANSEIDKLDRMGR